MKSRRLLALALVCLAVPAIASTPADVFRDLRAPSLGGAAPVSNITISLGHMKLNLASGSAAKLTAAGEQVGLFFKGHGSFEYVAEATELPLVTRNVKTDSNAKQSGATIGDDIAEVLILNAGETLPAIAD